MGENGTSTSQYVKLTKEQEAVEITPGELNQPVHVPQLNVRTCPECGQQLPAGFEIPADEPWMTGICGCAQDPESCMTGLFCPCVVFGRNVERFKEEIPWTNACVCHAICIEGGMTLAALISIFNGYIDANTLRLFGEGLLFAWWICGIYNGLFREELQKKYHLQDSPCDPCVVHCCMHWCALCQEHREMKGRLPENSMTPMTVVNPPPVQEMTSDQKRNSSVSSENEGDHHRPTGLEIQAV
ncbi:cell number regulator 6 [Beta vulgaris subsp. vulgaris]|uniref:cell number regulator 6 n=1 Tax=Beta vulgaris subsp. vulgaris TaxID=3555 RepID=UPI002036FFB2|nr:cell number regulator 6 [Beta vulgaris subsp. vulgaris]XP_048496373.1 cell number regulator 6 [Beta vulgaris subsp. vulgaris]